MSNEEKTLRFMFGVPMMNDVNVKMLDTALEVAHAVGMEYPEFLLAYVMKIFQTTLMTCKDFGIEVNLDGYCEALKMVLAGEAEMI